MRLLNISCCGGCSHRKTSHLLWFLIFTQLLSHSSAFFFPMFSNFFSNAAFRNNNNQNRNQFRGLAGIHEKLQQNTNGGVSIFSPSTASSNQSTSIRVPMFQRSLPNLERRVDIVTTVINPAPSDQSSVISDGNSTNTNGTTPQGVNGTHVEVHQNISTTFPDQTVQQTSQRLVIPTKTSVTSSITAIQNGFPVQVPVSGGGIGLTGINRNPDSLTLPFTPNMFGILSFVQALKDIKRNYKDQEMERKMEFHNKQNGGGDIMTRILRTLIQKVVNKHQKHTEFLKLKIRKKEAKMQSFLQLPMVAQVIAYDEARAAGLTQPQPQVQKVAGVLPQPKSLQLPHQHPHQAHQHPHQQHHPHPHHQHPHQQHQHPHHQQHQQHQNPHQQHQNQQQQHGLFGRRQGGPLRNLLNSFVG